MKFKAPLFFILILYFFISCADSNSEAVSDDAPEIDPFESAVPHGATLPSAELSAADKEKLSNAKGRVVNSLELPALLGRIEKANGLLTIFSFWSLSNENSLSLNEHLTKIQNDIGHNKIKLIFINIDPTPQKELLNTYVREKGIVDEVYYLNLTNVAENWKESIFSTWNGDLPSLLLVNKSVGTNLLYQQNFNYEELQALIQPLAL